MQTEYPKQDEAVLNEMADYYAGKYHSVYFVKCLNCKRVIAVEVPAVNGNTGRGMQIFGYQNLFKTCRTRLDSTGTGKKMVGYECACGNDTRLSSLEKGKVPVSGVVKNNLTGKVVARFGERVSLSPFERDRLAADVAQEEASGKVKADYEVKDNIERFETFELVRVR